jgi:hypothetical protein
MTLSPEQLSQRGRIGAHTLHATHDSRELTANARAAFQKRFLDQVDEATPGLPEGERLRRAEHLLRAHMTRLALASSRSRARKVAS